MILKITLMPQINEAFVWFNVNSTLQYTFDLCSNFSFVGIIFSRNWHLLFVLTLLISDLTFVLLLLSLWISVQPDIWKIFFLYHEWKQLFTRKCATNYYQTYLENQLNNFFTWNNTINEISNRRFCRMDNNYMSTFRGPGARYSETYCVTTLSADSVFISS
jgi:hypothetical protein